MADSKCVMHLAGVIAAALAVAGCRSSAQEINTTALEGGAPSASATATVEQGSATMPPASLQRPTQVAGLTMREAMRRAIAFSPVLQAARAEIEAKHGEAFQAGRRPNPTLDVEVENFAGSGELAGFDSAETTVALTQTIELGGKRLKRLKVAQLDTDVAQRDFEAARLKVASETLQAFVEVLAGQQRTTIHEEFVALTKRLSDIVAERVRAGKVSGVEANKAEVELAKAQVILQEELARLEVARQRLALFWGARSPDFSRAVGELASSNHLPPAGRFGAYLQRNPNITRWAAEMDRRQSALALEQARRIPNLRLGGGARRFEETGDSAAVATLSIDLPFFDRNRGNIDAANARLVKGHYEGETANTELTARFVESYGALRAAEAKLRSLKARVLPAATATYEATESGYREGKFDLLNLLDARRSLIETRLDIVNTQAEFHKAKAVIEGLIGRDLYSIR